MYEESIRVFENCTKYYNDMDVQMLMAYNYKELERYEETEQHFKIAAAMCPNRFYPLYELALLYDRTGRKEEAVALAEEIVDKDVKVPSPTIAAMKQRMEKLIQINKNEMPME